MIRAELSPGTLARVKGQQALDLDGTEADVVNAMLYLCSQQASFVTGRRFASPPAPRSRYER